MASPDQRAWRASKSDFALRPGHALGSRRSGISGSTNGKRRHSWTSWLSAANRASPVRGAPFEDVAAATRALAARTERLDPELATTAYIKEDRHGRVFVDSTRSGQATIVAAYSPRIRPSLPVSAPVGWDALDDVSPTDFTVTAAADRFPTDWAAELPEPQTLPADLVAEGHTIPIARVQAMHEGKRRKRAAQAEGG